MATATIPAVANAAPAVRAPRTAWAWLSEPVRAPAVVGAGGFASGILCAHLWWFRPGWLLVALLASFAIAAVAARRAPRMAWLSVLLVYVLLGILCAEIAPQVDRQRELATLADTTPRLVEGEVMRLGPVRRVMAASAFSDKTHEERSWQIDVRIASLATSAVRVTLYAPVGEPFPHIACGDKVRAILAMHQEERFLDPGVCDAGEYLLRQGVGALAGAKPEKFAVVGTGQGAFACRLHSLQMAASAKLMDFAHEARESRLSAFLRISQGDAAMLAAMIAGDRTYLARGVRAGFERASGCLARFKVRFGRGCGFAGAVVARDTAAGCGGDYARACGHHIGGMAAVLDNFRPLELWVGRNPDVPQDDRLLHEAEWLGTRIVAHTTGDTFAFGGTAVRVLAPAAEYRPGKAPANNDSLVLRMSYGGTSALLEGDAEAPSEARMLAEGGLRSDLLKVGHHGSRTSTTPAFLAAVAPEWAAISVGKRNFYGHPRREVLEDVADGTRSDVSDGYGGVDELLAGWCARDSAAVGRAGTLNLCVVVTGVVRRA